MKFIAIVRGKSLEYNTSFSSRGELMGKQLPLQLKM
jgi:hypothetical protein